MYFYSLILLWLVLKSYLSLYLGKKFLELLVDYIRQYRIVNANPTLQELQ